MNWFPAQITVIFRGIDELVACVDEVLGVLQDEIAFVKVLKHLVDLLALWTFIAFPFGRWTLTFRLKFLYVQVNFFNGFGQHACNLVHSGVDFLFFFGRGHGKLFGELHDDGLSIQILWTINKNYYISSLVKYRFNCLDLSISKYIIQKSPPSSRTFKRVVFFLAHYYYSIYLL